MLIILGIVAIVIFSIQVFQGANNTERNAPLWAMINVGVGVAFQFVIPFIAGIMLAVGFMLSGSTETTLINDISGWALVINIVCFVLSILAMFLVWKHVNKIKDIPVGSTEAPPPPPTFN